MATAETNVPLRHLSVRVPWHDSGWTGRVCMAPVLNGACAKLKRIADHKKDEQEQSLAERTLDELPQAQWPCCVEERAAFMAPFEMEHIKRHALAERNRSIYGHYRPTPQRYPAYSAGVIPFRWMMREYINEYREEFELDVDAGREPDLGYESTWIHQIDNQLALLDGFAAHLRPTHSLCFFYAKHVPFVEGTGRILVGAGRIKEKGRLIEYDREGEGMRGMIWERPVQHSIRPKGKDGFLMPYYELLKRREQDPSLDAERFAAKAPDEHWDEFSFASELVTHDGAIGALLSLDTSLGRFEKELGISAEWQRQWIHEELVRLWKVRGPFPGLGAVLKAFGLSRGVFIAHALQEKAGQNADPWPLVDKAFQSPAAVLPKELHRDLKELAPTWKGLPASRKTFLRLLSRFELTQEQASGLYEDGSRRKRGWGGTDAEIIHNPYRIYELGRHDLEGVRLLTVDRGVFPDDVVRLAHPLESPSGLESSVDLRRVRAFSIASLEDAAAGGHTLLARDQVVDAIVARPVSPPCPVTGDIITARVADMAPELVATEKDSGLALQLDRYKVLGELARIIHRRISMGEPRRF